MRTLTHRPTRTSSPLRNGLGRALAALAALLVAASTLVGAAMAAAQDGQDTFRPTGAGYTVSVGGHEYWFGAWHATPLDADDGND